MVVLRPAYPPRHGSAVASTTRRPDASQSLSAAGQGKRRFIRWHWLAAMAGQPPNADSHDDARTPTSSTTDVATFETFFRRYEPQLTGYLWRMTGDAEVARDLCQETFVRAWQRFAAVRHYDQPKAWLFRVATNLALNHRRRDDMVSLHDYDPASSDPSIRFVEREVVRQTLLSLSAKQRAMLILREVNALSYAEIGALLDMTPDAVKMAMSRAREQFRQHYRRSDH